MAYQYQYINKLRQFGETDYSLILTDDANIMPPVRIEKTFKMEEVLITNEFLDIEAQIDINIAIQNYNNSGS